MTILIQNYRYFWSQHQHTEYQSFLSIPTCVVSWNDRILNFLIFDIFFLGTAAVAKAMSNYLDSLLGDPQKTYMKKYFPIHMDFLGEYPDVASFLFIMTIASN